MESSSSNDLTDSNNGCDVIHIKNVPSLLSSYDESILDDKSEIFSMTSLGAFIFLNQAESKLSYGLDNAIAQNSHTTTDTTRLSLAYERLHSMPKLILQELSPYIVVLDISNNEFENLNFLTEFKKLTTLICDHNNITSSTEIPAMPKLELLWLNHCKIKELYPWGRKLQKSCPQLKYLSLMGNEAAPSYLNGGNFNEYLQYRLFMISMFPNLLHLDDKPVTAEQRKESKKLYKKSFLEKLKFLDNFTLSAQCVSPAAYTTYLEKNIVI
ncbi:PREDICTED: leucine-rich repeat-containing protein C10orf11 homolog [Nicrophorus vespilloides]|uniref:Leucine-rich repeat-containing protein C10orf11 homolog n=1 Tax=Nicrophorus vespilloides TaxID=110193 RepID=A0ABM1M391_NICVS|nr:PREDICTED: leucine-rich repeat-containing protein C10orf11 homolog [Nicrophorus vespilloides]